MTRELKQEYTLRISQTNSTQLVVIIYEMLLDYLKEGREALSVKDIENFHDSIRRATGCIRELSGSINNNTNISGNLFSLYVYCIKELARADLHHTVEELYNVELVIRKLYEAYKEATKDDMSSPIMNNTQLVYAGLTYGKESLIVNLNSSSSRGFVV